MNQFIFFSQVSQIKRDLIIQNQKCYREFLLHRYNCIRIFKFNFNDIRITSDITLQSVIGLKKLLKLLNITIKANALFNCRKKKLLEILNCSIITSFGGSQVLKFSDLNSNDLTIESFPEQKILQSIEYLVIALEDEGVDLYIYDQKIIQIFIKGVSQIYRKILKGIFYSQFIQNWSENI
ncbi:unnamed protein product [Paramecium sonneborni]|uniref:Uncharacterized protein n=1 Tax=Paramecium sonneborni TaxID=65129 RepID=A0A8S1KT46_9CILI|nr:unnamed protein product [Paramecium sonneborni]